uniref:Uncharacterized protein n=1 Tax=Grammatophora oceanica TaxID=210454 RepID=A0A7S1UV94_9STRA
MKMFVWAFPSTAVVAVQFLLLLSSPDHVVVAHDHGHRHEKPSSCPAPDVRADVFFRLVCDLTIPARRQLASNNAADQRHDRALGHHRRVDESDDDDDDGGDGEGFNDFESEFWVEFNDGTDNIKPFDYKENEIVSETLRVAYNTVFGCPNETFLNTVLVVDAFVVNVDLESEDIPERQRRDLQRTSQYTSLYQRYVASGRCRRCRSGSRLFNDIRFRRELRRILEEDATTDTFNDVVLTGLRAARFELDYVEASNTFPLLDCDDDGTYDIHLREEKECPVTPHPTPKPTPKPTPLPTKPSSKSSKRSKKASSKSHKSTKKSKKSGTSKSSKKVKKTKHSKKEHEGGYESDVRRVLRNYHYQ